MGLFNEKFLKRAIDIALQNIENARGGPFGAVIVKNEEIIAEGTNHVTTHNDPTAHAEVVAIRNACQKLNTFQLNDCEIYCSCEPCPMCLGAIYWARPKAVYFAAGKTDAANAGFDDSFIYNEIKLEYKNRRILTKLHPMKEALHVFQKWVKMENKTDY